MIYHFKIYHDATEMTRVSVPGIHTGACIHFLTAGRLAGYDIYYRVSNFIHAEAL
jgi:hypothetical protein